MKRYIHDARLRKNLFLGIVLILVYVGVNNLDSLTGFLGSILKIFSPFLIGGAIAFVLNVPMRQLESHMFTKPEYQTAKWAGRRRLISLLITLVGFIAILVFIFSIVVPQLTETIGQLIERIPNAFKDFTKWLDKLGKDHPDMQDFISDLNSYGDKFMQKFVAIISGASSSILNGSFQAVTGIIAGIANFLIGFVFAIYLLAQKDSLKTNALKVLYAFSDKDRADGYVEVLKRANKVFSSFISGQCLDALILGCTFFVVLTICQMPYATLISVIIAVCALVPILGAFVAAFIGALFILMVSPTKALVFLIIFIVLQQFDANVTYPHVVGNSVGLPGIWVLVSVTVGGGMFGLTGMLLFIPLMSVVYAMFRYTVYRKLDDKNITIDREFDVNTPETSTITHGGIEISETTTEEDDFEDKKPKGFTEILRGSLRETLSEPDPRDVKDSEGEDSEKKN